MNRIVCKKGMYTYTMSETTISYEEFGEIVMFGITVFDKNKIKEHRGWLLGYGVVILIFFWLLVSFPTNTHTFLCHNKTVDISNIKRVDDMWREFLFGSYRGSGAMIFSILLSLFIDFVALVSFVFLTKAPQMASVKAAKMKGDSDSQLN